jgi:small-conductance mechanosensitive channel
MKFLSRAGEAWQGIADKVLWKYGQVDITVEEVAEAAIILLAGRWISRRVAYWIVGRLPESVRESPAVQSRGARSLYIAFFLVFVLLALHVMGLPLTVFGFLGGAVALGFGFGAQNICSNLISGAILKLTHPVGTGDIVETDGRTGTIQLVGFRSTEILTFDGVRLLVPNSNILSTTIVTRTSHAKLLRGTLSVGVSYGADTRLVERLLRELVEAHPGVAHSPEHPNRVYFADFGDSALVFKVLYWVDIAGKNTLDSVGSELRHGILEAFRANKVEIPYPQLDVHLDRCGG